MSFLKIISFTFILFFTVSTQAQFQTWVNHNPYWEGVITLNDGTSKQGWIKVPHKTSLRKVRFKESLEGKKEKIHVDDIASVYVQSPNEQKGFLFEQSRINFKKKWNQKRNHLLLVIGRNDFVSFYVASQSYDVQRKSEDIVPTYRYTQGNDVPVTAYYIKKKTEPSAYMVFATNTAMRFRKFAEDYFKEDPSLVKDIKEKNIKLGKDLGQIMARFLETTKNM